MKIAIHAFGTRGDVQPYLALALELEARGHSVTVSAPRDFRTWIEGYGLTARCFDVDMAELLRRADALGVTRHPILAFRHRATMIDPMIEAILAEGIEGARGADIVIAHPKAQFSATGAEAAGARFVMTAPLPIITPTSDFPMPGVLARNRGRFWNRLSWLPLQFALYPFAKRINTARERLGLPPLEGGRLDYGKLGGRPCLRLTAISPHVIPRPSDWDGRSQMTGYWTLPGDREGLDRALDAFLDSGPPPVYVGFGSMVTRDASRLVDASVTGLARAGLRGVIARGWAALPDRSADHVHFMDGAPHDRLFPRCAAIVHHGGAGTTGAALAAGRPSLIVPFMADQPWWAQRLYEQGLGPAPLSPRRFTARRFAAALKELVGREAFAARCAERARRIAGDSGAARAADLIEADAVSER
ncbi:glycosyltransferase [Maricaulis sp.]|uniref:glycosyltransferase n=1 Tax=Maricaulis sp. TaxID=1486257 RepID=UPI00262B9C5E|nr:glycosyltransferase [Maricaulis sp.]